jgi:hypothetical protein
MTLLAYMTASLKALKRRTFAWRSDLWIWPSTFLTLLRKGAVVYPTTFHFFTGYNVLGRRPAAIVARR